MTIEDMLLLCFSIAVPACSSICDDVMFELSVAKSVSMMRPVAALVLVAMFDKLVLTWSRRLAVAPSAERTVLTLSMAVASRPMVALAVPVSSRSASRRRR